MAISIVLAMSFGSLTPQPVLAASFTGSQFLTWPRKSQDAFLQNSITMTGIVATQGRPDIADCINDWYGTDREAHALIHDSILETISDNREHHPQAVLLAIIQKRCGSFKAGGD